MKSAVLPVPFKGVAVAAELLKSRPERCAAWCFETLAGRHVEICGEAASAALTAARGIVLEAQRRGGLAAWVGRRSSAFFPPDFAAAGVDLDALLVVFAADQNEAYRALDILFRSGAFAVIVADLGPRGELPMAVQSRLAGLAKEHCVAFLELTRADRSGCKSARGSLASLRVEARCASQGEVFRAEVRAFKDKRTAPGWTHTESCHGPDGLC